MLQGFHLICTPYGFWLPNDERGSGSDFVRSPALMKFGPANPVTHSRSVAHRPFDPVICEMARASLKYEPVRFNLAQIRSIARGFERELAQYCAAIVVACAILRDHFHLVTGPCRYDIRRFAGRMKGAATKQLLAEGLHPFQHIVLPDGSHPSTVVREPVGGVLPHCRRHAPRHPVRREESDQGWTRSAEMVACSPYVPPKTPGAAHRR